MRIKIEDMSDNEIMDRLTKILRRQRYMGLRAWAYHDALWRRGIKPPTY